MKTKIPHGDDAQLHALLQEWKPELSLPPRFREQVWRRIERAETEPIRTLTLAQFFATWVATKLPRPALATTYVAVLLIIGAGMGWSQAQHENARVTTELGTRYAHAVDPYQSIP